MNRLTEMALRASYPGLESRATVSAVSSPTTYTSPEQALRPEWSPERAVTKGYLEQIYVYKCVDKISSAIARLPFRAGPNPDDPTTYSKGSPLVTLLGPPPNSPNPSWTPTMLWKYAISQYLIMGKFAWEIERNRNGKIIALWPLQVQHLNPIPDTSRRPKGYFSAFEYGQRGAPGYKVFQPNQVVYCFRPSLEDHRQPESVLQAAKIDISIAQLIDQYDYALLRNNAVPSTIVTTEKFAEPEMRRAFRQQFMSAFGGSGNAGKTMFLEADPDYSPDGAVSNNVSGKVSVERLGLTSDEMQSPQRRNSTIQDICVAFGTPLSILGDSTRSKFQNFDMDHKNWWGETLAPLAGEIDDQINVHLVPLVDPANQGWFDLTGVRALRPEKVYQPAQIIDLITAGVMMPDEGREALGLPPLKEVNKANQKLNPPEELKPPAPQPALPVGSSPKPSHTAGDRIQPARVNRSWTRLLEGTLSAVLTDQKQVIEQRARGRRNKDQSPADLFDAEYWRPRIEQQVGLIFGVIAEETDVPEGIAQRVANRLIEDTAWRLQAGLETAFDDIGQRAATLAKHEIAMLEQIPTDHIYVVLDAVRRGKLSPSTALTLVGGE